MQKYRHQEWGKNFFAPVYAFRLCSNLEQTITAWFPQVRIVQEFIFPLIGFMFEPSSESDPAAMLDKCLRIDLFLPGTHNITILSCSLSLIKSQFQQMYQKDRFDLVFDIFANMSDMQYMQIKPLHWASSLVQLVETFSHAYSDLCAFFRSGK